MLWSRKWSRIGVLFTPYLLLLPPDFLQIMKPIKNNKKNSKWFFKRQRDLQEFAFHGESTCQNDVNLQTLFFHPSQWSESSSSFSLDKASKLSNKVFTYLSSHETIYCIFKPIHLYFQMAGSSVHSIHPWVCFGDQLSYNGSKICQCFYHLQRPLFTRFPKINKGSSLNRT